MLTEQEEQELCRLELNPDWVEWMMLWPTGWTSLEPLPGESMAKWLAPGWFDDEHGLPRIIQETPHRVARLKAIGNGQVPSAAAMAWTILAER